MITDALIERYLTGDVPEELKRRIELQAAGDQSLRDRIAALKRERDAFLAQDPPAQFAHRLKTRLELDVESRGASREPVKVPWWRRPLVPTLATAMVLLFGIAVLVRLDTVSPKATHERALDDKDEIAAAPSPSPSAPAPDATPPPPAPPSVEAKEEPAPVLAEKSQLAKRSKDKAEKGDRTDDAKEEARRDRRNKNAGLDTGRETFGADAKGAGSVGGRYAEPPPPKADKRIAEKKSAEREEEWRPANDPAKTATKDVAPPVAEQRPDKSTESAWRPSDSAKEGAEARKPKAAAATESARAQGDAGGYAQPPTAAPPPATPATTARTTAQPPIAPPAPTTAQPAERSRDSDDAMTDVAVVAKAPGKAKKAEAKPESAKGKSADLDAAQNTPALVITPFAGTGAPKRVAFLSQTVRVHAGSSVRVVGTAPSGGVAVLLVDGNGHVEVIADVRDQSTLALSGRTVTIRQDVALVLVQFQGALPLAALQAEAAKQREGALSLRFIPAALSPRHVRIVIEE